MKEPEPNPSTAKPARRPEDRIVLQVLRAVDVCVSRLYHRTQVLAPHRLPHDGAGILVCNHISGLDPLLIQSVCPRVIVWMMAKEYYDIKALGWFFRQIEAIPVERAGRDLAATRAAMRALHNGRILGVFPEGRIEKERSLLPFQTGVAMMAIKTGVPIYPTYLEGTQRGKTMVDAFRFPNRATLAFGEPFTVPQTGTSKQELDDATALIKSSVETMRQFRRNLHPKQEI